MYKLYSLPSDWQRVPADMTVNSFHCEKCDWTTGKSAGQNFHENRAKFDQKSSFKRYARRASAIPLASGRERPLTRLEYGARRSERW